MKLGIAIVTLVAVASAADPDTNHPVGRVIRMMQGLSAKVEFDGKNEANLYTKFERWCANSIKELTTSIAKSKDDEASLVDSIASKEEQEKTLTDQIDDLSDEITKLQNAAGDAKKVRDDTAGVYSQAMADYKSTLDALAAAIKLMEDSKTGFVQELKMPVVRTALSLLEADAPDNLPQRRAIAMLLQSHTSPAPAPATYGYQDKDRPDLIVKGGLEDHVQKYKFKSDNVIELLKQLKLKFEDEQTAAETAETNSLNAYALAKQARDAAEKAADDSKTEKTKLRGEVQGDLVQHRSDLKSTRSDIDADTATLDSTKKSCIMKKEEWEERSKTREQEQEALAKAIEIMAEVSGVRTEAPENPIPPAQPVGFVSVSFLQVAQTPEAKAMALLRAASRSTHSKALERLAQQISIEPHGHFGAVINSIEKMIFKLSDEQMDEDKHKAWCDKEDEQTRASKDDKVDKIAELTLKINADAATIQRLSSEIADAESVISDIVAFNQEATEIRNTGKAENAEALKDSQEAQEAIAKATAVLDTFYKDSGMVKREAWEFVQQPVSLPPSPKTWSASYRGIADPTNQPSGIISVLTAIGEDFAKMEAETRAQEATDQSDYDDQMSKSTIDQARREKEVEMKSLEKKGVSDRHAEMSKTRKHVEDELEAVNQYLKDLEPACVTGDSTYDDRKAARAQEIAALHEAQAILQDAFKGSKSFLAVRRH